MLSIRKFTRHKDEDIWANLWNRAFKEFDDFRSLSVEDMLANERNPSFNDEGMYIAELSDEPAGIVNAYIDKMREEKKGFIRVLGVVPEFRRKGIGRKLAEQAIASLKERGMQTIQVGAVLDKPAGAKLWESMGFKQVRVFSLMKRNLENTPSDIGENPNVQLRKLRKDSEEDLKLLTWLDNEAFKEHFNHRPHSVEETKFFVEEDPIFKEQEWLFTLLQGIPVGYVGVGVDRKFNEEKKIEYGWIMDIGVLKSHRLKGIGTRLMIEGMKLLQAKGMTEALLGVDDQNPTRAIKLYEKVGFKGIVKEAAYQKTT